MSQSEIDLVSRRKLARHMRSKVRSEEYRKKRFRNSVYMWTTIFLLVGAPLVFYGGIEYGYWNKPTSTALNTYAGLVWMVVLLTFQRVFEKYREYQKRDDQLLRLETETLDLSEDDKAQQPQTTPA